MMIPACYGQTWDTVMIPHGSNSASYFAHIQWTNTYGSGAVTNLGLNLQNGTNMNIAYSGSQASYSPSAYPKRATLFSDGAIVLVGTNTMVKYSALASPMAYGAYQSHNALGGSCGWSVYLDAGTYNLIVYIHMWAGCGIATWYFNGVSMGTCDYYAAAYQQTVPVGGGPVTVTTAGRQQLKYVVTSKNGSSTGYLIPNVFILFEPTTD